MPPAFLLTHLLVDNRALASERRLIGLNINLEIMEVAYEYLRLASQLPNFQLTILLFRELG